VILWCCRDREYYQQLSVLSFISKGLQFTPVEPYLHTGWTWLVRVLVALGGFSGLTKILEWIFRGPRITGSLRQVSTGNFYVVGDNTNSMKYVGAHILLHVYVVNRRISPTTIKSFYVYAKLKGKWIRGTLLSIPVGFKLPEFPYVDFSKSNLMDKTGLELLEYGKGVNGWLCSAPLRTRHMGPSLK
jgi:hypothetical protein